MGIIAGRLGDYEREEKFYREAVRISSKWNGPLFNLALSQQRRGKLTEAMRTIDTAIARSPTPPSLVLKAMLVDKQNQPLDERDALLERAFSAYDPPAALSDFQLAWYRVGARLARDNAREQAAVDEHQRRGKSSESPIAGVLPATRNELARRPQ